MPGPRVTVTYDADTKPLKKGVADAAQATSSSMRSVGTTAAGVFAGGAALKAAGAAKNFFEGAITGAMEAEKANARFATTLKNTTHATDEQVAGANKFLASMSKQGAVAKSELRPAFETLLRSTHDVGKAQSALKLAMDTSAGSGKPLAAVSMAIGKAYQGNVGALGRLGIQTKKIVPNQAALTSASLASWKATVHYNEAVAKHGKNSEEARKAAGKLAEAHAKLTTAQTKTKKETLGTDAVMKSLAATFGGQASKQADTAAGRMKNAQLQFKAFQVTLGQALMPTITALVGVLSTTLLPVLQTVGNFFKRYPGMIYPVVGAVTALVVGVKLYNAYQNENIVVTKLVAAAQWLWNAAMSANPIALVVIAIIAVIAAIVLAYKKFDWFRAAIEVVWQAIQVAFHAIVDAGKWVVSWLAANWPKLLAILTGPVGLAVLMIVRHWDTIKSAASAVANWVVARWQSVVSFLSSMVGVIGGIIGRIVGVLKLPIKAAEEVWAGVKAWFDGLVSVLRGIVSGISSAVGSIVNAIKAPVNAIIRGLNAFHFTIPQISVGGSFGLPKISAGPWNIDLIPFTIPSLATGGVTTGAGLAYLHPAEVIAPLASVGAMGGNVYNITVEVPPGASPYAVGAATVDAIRSYERVAGTAWRSS